MLTDPDRQRELALRVRTHLCQIAGEGRPITYQALAKDLRLKPPNTIQQLTAALELTMEQDAAAARPLIAALVVSKLQRELPAPGFFECARRIGCFDGDNAGPDTRTFHTAEFGAATVFWRTAAGE